MEPASSSVTVVGGGIVGIVCASYLQRDGWAVTVVDRNGGEPGEMCSFGNTGGISPASVVPIAMPGMIRDVVKWLADPLGPLHIRWSYLPACLPWLIRFLRNSSPERVREISKALASLNRPTFDAYMPLLKEAGLEHLFKRSGQLFVYRDEQSFGHDRFALELKQAVGLPIEILGADEIQQLEPSISTDYRKAHFIPDHGHCINPYGLVEGLTRHFLQRGGVMLREDVVGFGFGPKGPQSLSTRSGTVIPVDRLVVAAGAWSGSLMAALGHHVPLETHRGYHVTVTDPGVMPRLMILSADDKIALTPMEMGLRLAGNVELAGLSAPPNFARARKLLRIGERVFPGLRTESYTEWMGHRPCLPDSLPVLGRSPRHANVFLAFGHGHQGLLGASETGRVISDLVAGRPAPINLHPFRIERF